MTQDHPPDDGAGADALPGAADDRDRRREAAALRRRLGDLRPRQCRRHRRGALPGARRAADLSAPTTSRRWRMRRSPMPRRISAAASWPRTSSIGPGATNMVTAAALAHVNRLPVLLLPGDVFANRVPDPVLQQVEDFGDGTVSANDCFRPVSRYFDRITRPEQIIPALNARHAGADRSGRMRPGDAGALPGRAGRGLRLSRKLLRASGVWTPRRPRPDARELARGGRGAEGGEEAADHRRRRRALFAGAGDARRFRRSARHSGLRDAGRQVVAAATTIRSTWRRSASPARRPPTGWPRRPTSCWRSARGCRISPPAPGRCSRTTARRSSGSTSQPFDAGKHRALPLVADAREGLKELAQALGGWKAPAAWTDNAQQGQGRVAEGRRQGDRRRPMPRCRRTRR